MPVAAPSYLGSDFSQAPPGHRFRLYFPGWEAAWRVTTAKYGALAECASIPDPAPLRALVARQQALAATENALVHETTLEAPLATGLGNPHPVENGLSFFDPHGLPYLGGSSVKGVVRATAEGMALTGEAGWSPAAVWWLFGFDEKSAWHDPKQERSALERALGTVELEKWTELEALLDAPSKKRLRENPVRWWLETRGADLPRVRGSLVIWDVFPVVQRLDVEIMTPHHTGYLQDDRPAPPMDHEEPVPIPFLVVPAGAQLTFVAQLRPPHAAPTWIRKTWKELTSAALDKALTGRGFGAKTVQGFGANLSPDSTEVRQVEFVTPAFIGGADPRRPEHATLRAATLRGELRWWWRTMHVGYLDTRELRALEDAIWGSVRTGKSPVVVRVVPDQQAAVPAPYKRLQGDGLAIDEAFLRQHAMPNPQGGPGVAYAAYGMAEGRDAHGPKQRFAIAPGSRYRVELSVARESRFGDETPAFAGKALTRDQLRAQTHAAWTLLCACGSFGAKARKGFGSVGEIGVASRPPAEAIQSANQVAERLRAELGAANLEYDSGRAGGALSLGALATTPVVVELSSDDAWWAMNAVGTAMREVASGWKHLRRKTVLGLPRKIHGPRDRPLNHQAADDHRPPESLRGTDPVADRHASPVRISLGKAQSGRLEVRIVAFVASMLPDAERSRTTLTEYVGLLRAQLETPPQPQPPREGPDRGPRPGPDQRRGPNRGAPPHQATPTRLGAPAPSVGQRVQVTLGRTKKGGWKGTCEQGGHTYSGPIVGGEAPPDAQEGMTVDVEIRSATPSSARERPAQFNWLSTK